MDLLTTFGKTDYTVTENLKRLAAGLAAVEAKVGSAGSTAGVDALREELRQLSSRVDVLARQVQVLQQAP